MALQLPKFKKGDRIQYRGTNRLGTVIGVERLHRNYHIRWDSQKEETWVWEAELLGPHGTETETL